MTKIDSFGLFVKKTTPSFADPSLKKEGSTPCANFVVTISCLHRKDDTARLVNLKWRACRLVQCVIGANSPPYQGGVRVGRGGFE